jgi:hypothetical protein
LFIISIIFDIFILLLSLNLIIYLIIYFYNKLNFIMNFLLTFLLINSNHYVMNSFVYNLEGDFTYLEDLRFFSSKMLFFLCYSIQCYQIILVCYIELMIYGELIEMNIYLFYLSKLFRMYIYSISKLWF